MRKYCARGNLKAPEKDEDLDKQFEIPILALGELAWKCLLNDELSFYEDELEELGRSNENIVARRLGLVYKEESLRRLKPRHSYSFLHKTFQEYLAASHIGHKFRRSEFQMLKQVLFPVIARSKFKQVFVFVCGILREEANIVFEQIGLNLLQKHWDWLKCDMSTAIFFLDSWEETGNADRMSKTLLSFLPFPRPLHVWSQEQWNVLCYVLKKCTEFSEELTFAAAEVHLSPRLVPFLSILQYGKPPDLTSFILYGVSMADHESVYKSLRQWSFREKFTFALFADYGGSVSKLPDFGFSSVCLRICGSLGSSSLHDFENLLLHKCLSSLSITVCGDVQESLVEALARGLAGESVVKFLDLCVNGNFSFRGASLLKEGIIRNRSLTNVKISVNGEPTENWQVVAKNLRAQFAEKAILSEIYPNTFSKVKDTQVTHLNPFLSKTDLKQRTVTLNVWGELCGDGCKALCEVLLHTPVSHLTLNIYGQLTDEILRYIARCVEEQEKLSPITINAWIEMTETENKLIKELGLDKNPLFSLNVRGTSAPVKESSDGKVFSSDEPQSLIEFHAKTAEGPSFEFTEDPSQKSLTIKVNESEHGVREGLAGNTYLKSRTLEINDEWGLGLGEGLARYTSLELLTLQIITDSLVSSKWAHGLGEWLAGNTSLKSLTLEIYEFCNDSYEWGRGLGEGLARNTSLDSLTVKIVIDWFVKSKWVRGLGEGLAGNTSLKSLTLEIKDRADNDDEWGRSLGEGLARNTSLESLTIKIVKRTTFRTARNTWEHSLGEGLAGNTSLKSLTLELDSFLSCYDKWVIAKGLARNTSIESLTIKIRIAFNVGNQWKHGLCEGLAGNASVKSLILEIVLKSTGDNEWGRCLGESLARNTSVESLTVKIMKGSCYVESSEWLHGLGEGLAGDTSLKSLTLEIYEHRCRTLMRGLRNIDEWGRSLARNTSLECLRIKVIKSSFVNDEWVYGLCKGLSGNTSLKSLTLEIDDFYPCIDPSWRYDLDEGLARSTSLESLTLAINNCDGRSNKWGHVLRENLAKINSLNSLTLTINNFSCISDEWGVALAESLEKTASLKSITLTMNNYFYVSSVWGLGLFEGSARNMSLKSITLSINNYGTMKGKRRHDIIEGLATHSSLTSVTLAINNYGDMKGEWAHYLVEGLARNTSLNSLTLTANNYGDMNEEWRCALRESLRKSKSLTECNLVVDICGKC